MFKTIALMMFTVLALDAAASPGCRARQERGPRPEVSVTPVAQADDGAKAELKVLAEGSHSSVTHPFVGIARDPETYSAMLKLDGNLPKLEDGFFNSNVAIVAFLGERNTGGFGVDITREPGGQLRIAEKTPAKGMMVTEMITSPFKVVSVSITGLQPLAISFDDAWRKQMRSYRITSGTFTMQGGIAGVHEEFALQGQVLIMREGNLATFAFALTGSGEGKQRSLSDVATGLTQKDGLVINKMSSDSLVTPPSPGLKAFGTLTAGEGKLKLSFGPLPSVVADGFFGDGSFEAESLSSATKP
jgi:PrcB C-terminal